MDYSQFYSQEARRFTKASLAGLINRFAGVDGVVSLAGGLPPAEAFPLTSLRASLVDGTEIELGALGQQAYMAQQYNFNPQGYPPLLDWLRTLTRSLHSVHVAGPTDAPGPAGPAGPSSAPSPPPPRDLVLSCGAIHAICAIISCFTDPGDTLVVDEYTYTHALECVFLPRDLRLLPVRGDAQGMDPDHLDSQLRAAARAAEAGACSRPRLLYSIPTGHNPTGTVMGEERKRRILQVAEAHDLLILEDDAYYWLYYPRGALPAEEQPGMEGLPRSLMSCDTTGRVIRVDTFSKLLGPGYRLGWITAPQPIVSKLANWVMASTVGPCSVTQVLVCRILTQWGLHGFAAYLRKLQALYAGRAASAHEAASAHLAGLATWQPVAAGMFMWLELQGVPDVAAVLDDLVAAKVVAVPGSMFSTRGLKRGTALDCAHAPARAALSAMLGAAGAGGMQRPWARAACTLAAAMLAFPLEQVEAAPPDKVAAAPAAAAARGGGSSLGADAPSATGSGGRSRAWGAESMMARSQATATHVDVASHQWREYVAASQHVAPGSEGTSVAVGGQDCRRINLPKETQRVRLSELKPPMTLQQMFTASKAGQGGYGCAAVETSGVHLLFAHLLLNKLIPASFLPRFGNDFRGSQPAHCTALPFGGSLRGRGLSWTSQEAATQSLSETRPRMPQHFVRLRWAAVAVCAQRGPSPCGTAAEEPLGQTSTSSGVASAAGASPPASSKGERASDDQCSMCGAVAIVGQPWEPEHEDVVEISFHGSCTHVVMASTSDGWPVSAQVKALLMDVARKGLTDGASKNPSVLQAAMTEAIRQLNPGLLAHRNLAVLPTAEALRKDGQRRAAGEHVTITGGSLYDRLVALRRELADRHTRELVATKTDESKVLFKGYISEIKEPFVVITMTNESVLQYAMRLRSCRVLAAPLYVDSVGDRMAPPDEHKGKLLLTTHWVLPSVQSLQPGTTRHQGGRGINVQTLHSIRRDASVYRDAFSHLADVAAKVPAVDKQPLRGFPSAYMSDEDGAIMLGFAEATGFRFVASQYRHVEADCRTYGEAVRCAVEQLEPPGHYNYLEASFEENDGLLSLLAQVTGGKGTWYGHTTLPCVLQRAVDVSLEVHEEKELQRQQEENMRKAAACMKACGVHFKREPKFIERPAVMSDKVLPMLCASHYIKNKFQHMRHSNLTRKLPVNERAWFALVEGELMGAPIKTWLYRGPEKLAVVDWAFEGMAMLLRQEFFAPGDYAEHPMLGPFFTVRTGTVADQRAGRPVPLWVYAISPRLKTLKDKVFMARVYDQGTPPDKTSDLEEELGTPPDKTSDLEEELETPPDSSQDGAWDDPGGTPGAEEYELASPGVAPTSAVRNPFYMAVMHRRQLRLPLHERCQQQRGLVAAAAPLLHPLLPVLNRSQDTAMSIPRETTLRTTGVVEAENMITGRVDKERSGHAPDPVKYLAAQYTIDTQTSLQSLMNMQRGASVGPLLGRSSRSLGAMQRKVQRSQLLPQQQLAVSVEATAHAASRAGDDVTFYTWLSGCLDGPAGQLVREHLSVPLDSAPVEVLAAAGGLDASRRLRLMDVVVRQLGASSCMPAASDGASEDEEELEEVGEREEWEEEEGDYAQPSRSQLSEWGRRRKGGRPRGRAVSPPRTVPATGMAASCNGLTQKGQRCLACPAKGCTHGMCGRHCSKRHRESSSSLTQPNVLMSWILVLLY